MQGSHCRACEERQVFKMAVIELRPAFIGLGRGVVRHGQYVSWWQQRQERRQLCLRRCGKIVRYQ